MARAQKPPLAGQARLASSNQTDVVRFVSSRRNSPFFGHPHMRCTVVVRCTRYAKWFALLPVADYFTLGPRAVTFFIWLSLYHEITHSMNSREPGLSQILIIFGITLDVISYCLLYCIGSSSDYIVSNIRHFEIFGCILIFIGIDIQPVTLIGFTLSMMFPWRNERR